MRQWIGVAARLIVGGVYLASGLLKVGDPYESVRAVRAFQILPEAIVPLVGHTLPILEIMLGATLVAGLLTRASGVVSMLFQIAFIIGIASAWARGLSIDCGCFGGGGFKADAAKQYPWDIARDIGLLLLSAYLVWRPRTPYSLDNLIFRPTTAEVVTPGLEPGPETGEEA